MIEALLAIQIVTQIFLFLVALQWLNGKFVEIQDSVNDLANAIRQSRNGNNASASDNHIVSNADGNGGPFIFVDDDETMIELCSNSLKTFIRKVMGGEKVKQL